MSNAGQKRVLYVNLSCQKAEVKVHSNYEGSLGGVGLAAALYQDLFELDPVVFAAGPLAGLFPYASATCAVFRSPLTHDWAETYAGGWLAVVLRTAQLDAVVFSGVSKAPVCISIVDSEVTFESAEQLWGSGNVETYRILSDRLGLSGKRSLITIGQAGEKQISFASALVDGIFEFRRLGLGARMGSMGIKGVVVSGTGTLPAVRERVYGPAYDQILQAVQQPQGGLFPGFNTASSLAGLSEQNRLGGIPVRNATDHRFESQAFNEDTFIREGRPTPVSSFGNPLPDESLFSVEDQRVPLDYDASVGLGAMIGVEDVSSILQLRYLALDYGLDPLSLGSALAYLTEVKELSFGDVETYTTLIHSLVAQQEEWSPTLAKGVAVAAKEHGNTDIGMHIAGVAIAPYYNGYATVLSQLFGHSHQVEDSEGHQFDLGLLGKDFEDHQLVKALIEREKVVGVLQCLCIMYPARGLYADPSVLFSILSSVGLAWSRDDLDNLATDLYHLKRSIKQAMRVAPPSVSSLPSRLFSTPTANGVLKKERLRALARIYRDELQKNE